jgi:DNA-binding response OmpR family regulator
LQSYGEARLDRRTARPETPPSGRVASVAALPRMRAAPGHRALVIDSSAQARTVVRSLLEGAGLTVTEAADGESGLEIARRTAPDLVVLDVSLPGIDGFEVCRRLRGFTDAYVMMLTARSDEDDKLAGLELGADDFVTKPFSPRELVARARAMLRRPRRPSAAQVVRVFGDLRIDVLAREVSLAGEPVTLTRLEWEILDVLSSRPRVVLTRRQLMDAVWGENWVGSEHLVDVHVSNLRRKLREDPRRPRFVQTVHGVGFRMADGR